MGERHRRWRLGEHGRTLGRQLRHQGRRGVLVPVTTKNGEYSIVQGLSIDEFSRKRMDASEAELREERDGVKDLL
jgi:malate dehydrogenase